MHSCGAARRLIPGAVALVASALLSHATPAAGAAAARQPDARTLFDTACAACHGPDGRGGQHVMHMQTMDAPDIRWSVLSGEMEGEHGGETETESGHGDGDSGYDFDKFRLAVVEGKHPDNTSLSSNMPRWNIGDEDLADIMDYLKNLP